MSLECEKHFLPQFQKTALVESFVALLEFYVISKSRNILNNSYQDQGV